jgi:DNA end-binding protein Ku
MPRAIWTGSISFGLVNVPVKLYSATSDNELHFNQFEEGTSDRVRYKRVNERTGKEVPYEKIVKGYEVSKDNFVIVTPEELEEYDPEATRTIDIEDFVDIDEIDPIYYERTYYLAPDGGSQGTIKAYNLLLKAMEDKGKIGVGRMVMRTKQYLVAARPLDGVLALSTMRFADEVRDRSEIDIPSGKKADVSKREVDMAGQIIDSLTVDWKPERYEDTYREEVLELIQRKAKGEDIVAKTEAPEQAKVIDLMAALEASLEQARGGKRPAKSSPSKASKTSKASKASKKKSSGSKKSSSSSTKQNASSKSRARKSA